MHVATTTVAEGSCLLVSAISVSACLPCPTRTLWIPILFNLTKRLSAATFESATARMRSPSGAKMDAQTARMAQATCVFPVPGGPWIRLSRCCSDFVIDSRCEGVKDSMSGCSAASLSRCSAASSWLSPPRAVSSANNRASSASARITSRMASENAYSGFRPSKFSLNTGSLTCVRLRSASNCRLIGVSNARKYKRNCLPIVMGDALGCRSLTSVPLTSEPKFEIRRRCSFTSSSKAGLPAKLVTMASQASGCCHPVLFPISASVSVASFLDGSSAASLGTSSTKSAAFNARWPSIIAEISVPAGAVKTT
mmetsp:Transcript_59649/g.142251  ORF Transcript_59649/g.142251 Transcript_59649/m.142251 type:complete len:310 (-) Transcript_59649:118-1047(-)